MIVAGFGFTTQATSRSLDSALQATGYDGKIAVIATPHDKAVEPALQDFAKARALPVQAIQPAALADTPTVTHSIVSHQARRTGSVAEAAALAAAGPGAELIVTRKISNDRMATCAIAKGPDT